MKFKNNIEVQAGLKDSSGSIGSSSQVLSSNGTNVAWVSLSSYVSGTGTTNYVSKFTGATSVGNSQIFDNGTNVGINTATPGAKLEVNGDFITNPTSATSNRIRIGQPATPNAVGRGIWFGNITADFTNFSFLKYNNETILNTDAGGAVYIRVGNSNKLAILDSGNVGVGTITPGAKLEVNGTIKTTNNNLSFTGTSLYAGNADGTAFGYTPADGISSITDLPAIESGWVSSFKYNGQTLEKCTAGEDITKGQLLYLRSNGTWELADANATASSTPLLGIALDTVSAAGSLAVLLDGIIITKEHAQAGSVTVGAPLYIETSSVGSAGNVTETAPTSGGEFVRLIGHNISDITGGVIIRFQPDNTWVEL